MSKTININEEVLDHIHSFIIEIYIHKSTYELKYEDHKFYYIDEDTDSSKHFISVKKINEIIRTYDREFSIDKFRSINDPQQIYYEMGMVFTKKHDMPASNKITQLDIMKPLTNMDDDIHLLIDLFTDIMSPYENYYEGGIDTNEDLDFYNYIELEEIKNNKIIGRYTAIKENGSYIYKNTKNDSTLASDYLADVFQDYSIKSVIYGSSIDMLDDGVNDHTSLMITTCYKKLAFVKISFADMLLYMVLARCYILNWDEVKYSNALEKRSK